jgi:uncharacterized membrane protein
MGEHMKFKLNAICAAVAVAVSAPAVVHANSSLEKLMNNPKKLGCSIWGFL